MKIFQSITENIWIELVNIPLTTLTSEQKQLLFSTDPEDAPAKAALREIIRASREVVVTGEKLSELITFYNTIKPALKDGDTYQFIGVDLSEKSENVFSGILNCRVNGEHKQVRF
jgi:hypothetical protein